MATISITPQGGNANSRTIAWENVTGSDDGEPLELPKLADKTVQVFGTFGDDLTIQGSNDPRVLSDPNNAVWSTLNDFQNTSLVLTAAGTRLIAENPRFIRPLAAASITSVTVIVQATGG